MTDKPDPRALLMGDLRDEIDNSPDYRAQHERVRARLFGARAPEETTTMNGQCRNTSLRYLAAASTVLPSTLLGRCERIRLSGCSRWSRREGLALLWLGRLRLWCVDLSGVQREVRSETYRADPAATRALVQSSYLVEVYPEHRARVVAR